MGRQEVESEDLLRIVGLHKSFASRAGQATVHAVDGVSLSVEEGQMFTLLGPSGCGKTTILRSVAGLERPESGEIWIDHKLVYAAGNRRRRWTSPEHRPIGMVFQSYAIWPHMTVFDNVAFPLTHGRQRMSAREARPLVHDMLERVGLGRFVNSWASNLSGGQQQRVALSRALVGKPKVLLLDEPLSNLDANLRVSLRRELKRLQLELKVTALYVTHDQGEALALSDRIAVLREGQLRQVGSPQELYAAPRDAYVADLLGINVFSGRVSSGGSAPVVESEFGIVTSRAAASGNTDLTLMTGQHVNCLVRPEDVRIVPAGGAPANGEVRGQVVASDFVGGHRDCVVRLSRSCELRGWAGATTELRPGDAVEVRFAADSVVVMSVESPGPAREGDGLAGGDGSSGERRSA